MQECVFRGLSARTWFFGVCVALAAIGASATQSTANTSPLPPAPEAENGYIRTRLVRVTSNLVVQADLDLGDKRVNFARPLTLEFGTRTLDLPGMTLKRNSWHYMNNSRTVRASVIKPRGDTSHARFRLYVRNWSDTLPGGTEFHLGLTRGDFEVDADVTLVDGTSYRLYRNDATNPPLAITKIVATTTGTGDDYLSATYDFPSNGTVPDTAPVLTLRSGEPGNHWETCLPTASHVTQRTARGYRFLGVDENGRRQTTTGAWFVEVDYVLRRIRVRANGIDLGSFSGASDPFYVAVGLDGVENAVQVCVDKSGTRLLYR